MMKKITLSALALTLLSGAAMAYDNADSKATLAKQREQAVAAQQKSTIDQTDSQSGQK